MFRRKNHVAGVAGWALATMSLALPDGRTAARPQSQSTPSATAPGQLQPADGGEAAAAKESAPRAERMVATLEISDAAQAARIRELLVTQFRALGEIHSALAAKIADATQAPAGDPTVVNAWVVVARVHTSVKLSQLHRHFVSRLEAELTPEQVGKVKNAITSDALPTTQARYLEMLPSLTADEKREVLANLLEAREYAMDAGSAAEQQQIFEQYRRRIDDALREAGHDLEQAAKDFAARERPANADDSQ